MPAPYPEQAPVLLPVKKSTALLSDSQRKRVKRDQKIISTYNKLLATGNRKVAIETMLKKKFGVGRSTLQRILSKSDQQETPS